MVFQNPTTFRWAVVMSIAALGLGGFGVPLYFRIQKAHEDYSVQKARNDLIKARTAIDAAATEYKAHVSQNTEYIEWISDLRDLTKELNITSENMSPMITTAGGTSPLYQKLVIRAELIGPIANLIRFIGTLETQQIRVNVTEWRLSPFLENQTVSLSRLSITMAMLMRMPVQKKKGESSTSAGKPDLLAKAKTGKFRAVEEEGIVAPPVIISTRTPEEFSKDAKNAKAQTPNKKHPSAKPAEQDRKQGKFSMEEDGVPAGIQAAATQQNTPDQGNADKVPAAH